MTGEENCACGHVYDEHDEDAICRIEGCDCFYFEYDPGEEKEE